MNQSKRRIAIVTDSSAFLPVGWAEAHQIHVVPLTLTLGEKSWRDGIDIDPPAFYELLRTTQDFPKTSQPNVATFERLFSDLAPQVDGIVTVCVSGKLSGTVSSAQTAAAYVSESTIRVIDSGSTSMGMGFAIREASRIADTGADLETVTHKVYEMLERTQLYFVLGTLEYLHRGGRIGSVAKLLGSALDLKPILQFHDGVIKATRKVRTRRKALDTVFGLIDKQVPVGSQAHMCVVNVAAGEEAAEVKKRLAEQFHPMELVETECSPAIGAHAGPGTVAIAFYVD